MKKMELTPAGDFHVSNQRGKVVICPMRCLNGVIGYSDVLNKDLETIVANEYGYVEPRHEITCIRVFPTETRL